jgi:hypothetical protein
MKIWVKICILSWISFIGIFGISYTVLAASEEVTSFKSEVVINMDATVTISETIQYNFGTQAVEKHGIYRKIPVDYAIDGGIKQTEISNLSVINEKGIPEPYTKSMSGGYLELKIGEATRHVTGEKTYYITYTEKYVINYFTELDELYFNVNGTGWPVPIREISAKIVLPGAFAENQIKKTCYIGTYNSRTSCSISEYGLDSTGKIVAITFEQKNLSVGDNLTVVAGFPTGIIPKLTAPIKNNQDIPITPDVIVFGIAMISILPIITLIIMIFFWVRRGRDPKGKGVIVAQYESPDGLSPLEVGAVLDERIENREITAEIIYLATKGYIKITRIPKKVLFVKWDDYELTKLKDFDKNVTGADAAFFGSLFGTKTTIKTSDIKTEHAEDMENMLKNLKAGVFTHLTELGYYVKSPYEIRKKYLVISGVFSTIGIILIVTVALGVFGAGLLISGLIILLFSFIMPAKTKKGAETKELILGLKEYMSVAEKDRLKFHNAPKKDPKKFEELLPFAIALGVEKEWAKQFKDIYNIQPSWYNDSSGASFNAVLFTHSLGTFNTQVSSAVVGSSAAGGSSGFGGGGFSGGGFGGGGGGSW